MKKIWNGCWGAACLVLATGSVQAQIDANYAPIRSNTAIPASFYTLTVDDIKGKIKGGESLESTKLKKLSEDIYFFRKEFAEAGNFYLKNDVSDYVQSIVDEILLTMPQYKDDFEFYLSRSMEVNAFCMADGTIIVNIGLIASLDNESELAFIIAHELSHYIKEHSVTDMKRTTDVAAMDDANIQSNRNLFRRLQFSRDSEFDADGFAVNILAQTSFDPMAGVSALEKLKSADTLIDTDPKLELLNKYFKTEYCDYDSSWITDDAIEKIRNSESDWDLTKILLAEYGDLLSTHPEIEKRQYALKEIIGSLDKSDIEQVKHLERKTFDVIKDMCAFEMVENSLRESYYTHAMFRAIRLLEKYPDNLYLNTTLSKALYWISYYKEINSGKNKVRQPVTVNDKSYFRIRSIIEHLDVSGAKKLSYGNAKILSEELPSNELSLFYMALNTEHYLAKNASFNYYNKYLKSYPNGRFVEFVNNRLSYMK